MPFENSAISPSSFPTLPNHQNRLALRSASYESLDSIGTFSPRATKDHQPMTIDMLYDTGAWMPDVPSLPPVENTLLNCFPSPRIPSAYSSIDRFDPFLDLGEGIGSPFIEDDDMDISDHISELFDSDGSLLIEDDQMVIIQLPIAELARAPPGVTGSATEGSSVSKSGEESEKNSAAEQEKESSEIESSEYESEEPSRGKEQDSLEEVNDYWANLWKLSADPSNFGADLSPIPDVSEGADSTQSSASDEEPPAIVRLSAYETYFVKRGCDTSSDSDIEGGSSGEEADDEADSEQDLSEEYSDAEQELVEENRSVRSAHTDYVVDDAPLELKDLREVTSGSGEANDNDDGAEPVDCAGPSHDGSGRLSRRRKFGDAFSSAGAASGSSISLTPRARDLEGGAALSGADDVIAGGSVRDAARRLEYQKRAKIGGEFSGSTDAAARGWTTTDNGESVEVQRGRILQSGGKWRGLRH